MFRCVLGPRVVGTLLCLMCLAGTAHAAPAPGWRAYVEAPASKSVHPVRITGVEGNVSTPEALTTGTGTTTLTYDEGGVPPVIDLDYGQVVGGFPAFNVTAFTGAPVLKAAFSETAIGLAPDGDYAGKQRLTRIQQFAIKSTGRVRSRMLEGGERYESLTLTEPGTLTLSAAGIVFSPVRATADSLRGNFLSSDPLLNRIWYAGVYTVNLDQLKPGTRPSPGIASSKPLLLDGAKRDRKVWVGDLLTADPTVFYSLDPTYVRESLRLIGRHPAAGYEDPDEPAPLTGVCSPNTIGGTGCLFYSATYSMMFVTALADYYRFTGDKSFVRRMWRAVDRQMAWDDEQVDERGLFATDALTGFNWNLEVFSGELTYVNAVYAQALDGATELATALGQDSDAKRFERRSASVKTAVNRYLFNKSRGLYEVSTTQRGIVTQDANVNAVLSGIASPTRGAGALAAIDSALSTPYGMLSVSRPAPANFRPVISPYMAGLQLQAEFETGRTEAALRLMRTEWGWMLAHDPQSTFWEKIQTDGRLTPRASAAHAWSTGATSALSRYVLGAAPATAGWREWTVMPHPSDLTFTRGSVPTPEGDLGVRWTHDGDTFKLSVDAPKHTTGTVWVPLLGDSHTVTRDGKVVFKDKVGGTVPGVKREGDYVIVPSQSGSHRYGWKPAPKQHDQKS